MIDPFNPPPARRSHQRQLVELLLRLAGRRGRMTGAEIGVALGHTSARLMQEFPRLTLWMVDVWDQAAADSSWRKTGDKRSRLTLADQIARMGQATRGVSFAIERARIMRAPSTEVAEWLSRHHKGRFDFVFIDGDHSYDGTKGDIEAWYPLVRPGGLFSGHDYLSHKYKGVKQAVDEFFASHPELTFYQGTDGAESTWYTWKHPEGKTNESARRTESLPE